MKKGIYDKFGEEGLKGGIPLEFGDDNAWSDGYVFHNDPHRVFKEFFGGDNPFAGTWKGLGWSRTHLWLSPCHGHHESSKLCGAVSLPSDSGAAGPWFLRVRSCLAPVSGGREP